jgi:hypothetical protein
LSAVNVYSFRDLLFTRGGGLVKDCGRIETFPRR